VTKLRAAHQSFIEQFNMTEVSFVPGGTVTTPNGFRAGAVYAGIKTPGPDKLDVGILASDSPCSAAAVFTKNLVKGAPVIVSQGHVKDHRVRAIVANAGCANVCTGEQGIEDALEMCRLTATKIGIEISEMAVCSTGVIGHYLPMDKIRNGISKVELSPDGGMELARAIMTTDTFAKHCAVEFTSDGVTYRVGGISKGAGMIHPDMATMFGFLTTDAPVAPAFLDKVLRDVADDTFNMISVDGDTSTSDTVIILANGAAGGEAIDEGHSAAASFAAAVRMVSEDLAKKLARDGEGATKLIEARVENALTIEDARKVARTLTLSPLLKSAVYGNDPNWGRVMMAVGRSGAQIDPDKASVFIGDICTFERGRAILFDEVAASDSLRQEEVKIRVDLGIGPASATGWGCDLTDEYVHINSDYTT
jgi:glutamate N-acetyltransferase / amino-acid N-acetyltransferase